MQEAESRTEENFYRQTAGKNKKDLSEQRLEETQRPTRKDDVVTFEQLGVDRLFVDESHITRTFSCIQKCGM